MSALIYENENNYKRVEKYRRDGKNFCIEISRHSIYGESKWCIYAYVYKDHPMFGNLESIEPENYYGSCVIGDFPLHGGCTYFRVHWDSNRKSINSIQIGANYSHLHDDRFKELHSLESAHEILRDAEELYDFLSDTENSDD